LHVRHKRPDLGMDRDPRQFVIIQAGAPQAPILERESERLDKVQARSGIRAQPYDIARVRRDFRLIKNDMKQGG